MRVSVIISNRNDVSMLAVTFRSAIEELSSIPGGGEVIIADNSYEDVYKAVKAVIPVTYIKQGKVKIVRQEYPCLFTAREAAAKEASGEYIFCVDSHCLFGKDSILNAVNFMNKNRRKNIGFGHIPINWLCQHERAARHDMTFLHGTWGRLYDKPKPITWKGMPWICRKDWFINDLNGYGALSENKMSWGGGDMYLGVKSWLLGYENWAIPSRPIIHIGPVPDIAKKYHKYRLYSDSGEGFAGLGFVVAFLALGAEEYLMSYPVRVKFLKQKFNIVVEDHLDVAKTLAENDREWISKNQVITVDNLRDWSPWDSFEYEDTLKEYKKTFNAQKSIKAEDWRIIKRTMLENNVKKVLEFGAGLSSVLFRKTVRHKETYETDSDYSSKLLNTYRDSIAPISLWKNNGHIKTNLDKYDMVFVDGVSPRRPQMEVAKKVSDLVVVHDGYTPPDKQAANELFANWEEVKNGTVRTRVFKRMQNATD